MELARQQHDGEERQQRHGHERADLRLAGEHRRRIGLLHGLREQRGWAVEHVEGDEYADGEKGDELDDRLGRDRQHQSVLVLGGVDVAGAEQHRERRHGECHEQRDVAEHRLRVAGIGRDLRQDGAERRRHRFELQRDVGNRADDGDQRDGRSHRLALAVARRDEVCDRGDVLRLGEPHDAHDERPKQPDHQHRPDVDRQEIIAGARGEPDRAEERPGGAIDRERERIDQQPVGTIAPELAHAVAIARHHEQQSDVGERDADDDPALQHACSCAIYRETQRSTIDCARPCPQHDGRLSKCFRKS